MNNDCREFRFHGNHEAWVRGYSSEIYDLLNGFVVNFTDNVMAFTDPTWAYLMEVGSCEPPAGMERFIFLPFTTNDTTWLVWKRQNKPTWLF
jgi:hypothetical protein